MPRKQAGNCAEGCSVEAALNLINGKWKGVVLYHLFRDHTLRFGELRRRLPTVTQRMLTKQLREMEEDGLIERKVFAVVPPRVDYSLADKGRSLEPVIRALELWGQENTGPLGV